jgi:hypothetical protein
MNHRILNRASRSSQPSAVERRKSKIAYEDLFAEALRLYRSDLVYTDGELLDALKARWPDQARDDVFCAAYEAGIAPAQPEAVSGRLGRPNGPKAGARKVA